MLETDECGGDISRYGESNTVIRLDGGIVPVECEPKVELSCPVGFHGVVIVQDLFKVKGIGLVYVLDTKVVDT